MALSETPEQRSEIAAVFDELGKRIRDLKREAESARRRSGGTRDIEAEVSAALDVIRRLPETAADETSYPALGNLFRQLNVRMFCRFNEMATGKRIVNMLAGGVLAIGSAPAPIQPYEGPTARKEVKTDTTEEATAERNAKYPPPPKPSSSGREGDSLGNVGRGDRI